MKPKESLNPSLKQKFKQFVFGDKKQDDKQANKGNEYSKSEEVIIYQEINNEDDDYALQQFINSHQQSINSLPSENSYDNLDPSLYVQSQRSKESSFAVIQASPQDFYNKHTDYRRLEQNQQIYDNFYTVFGGEKSATFKTLPDLPTIRTLQQPENCFSEAILIDRDNDPNYQDIENQFYQIFLDDSEDKPLFYKISKLTQMVCKAMGGDLLKDGCQNLEQTFQRRYLRQNQNNILCLIGNLQFGLSRHRALLFKAILSTLNVACQLKIKTTQDDKIKLESYKAVCVIRQKEEDYIMIVNFLDGMVLKVTSSGRPNPWYILEQNVMQKKGLITKQDIQNRKSQQNIQVGISENSMKNSQQMKPKEQPPNLQRKSFPDQRYQFNNSNVQQQLYNMYQDQPQDGIHQRSQTTDVPVQQPVMNSFDGTQVAQSYLAQKQQQIPKLNQQYIQHNQRLEPTQGQFDKVPHRYQPRPQGIQAITQQLHSNQQNQQKNAQQLFNKPFSTPFSNTPQKSPEYIKWQEQEYQKHQERINTINKQKQQNNQTHVNQAHRQGHKAQSQAPQTPFSDQVQSQMQGQGQPQNFLSQNQRQDQWKFLRENNGYHPHNNLQHRSNTNQTASSSSNQIQQSQNSDTSQLSPSNATSNTLEQPMQRTQSPFQQNNQPFSPIGEQIHAFAQDNYSSIFTGGHQDNSFNRSQDHVENEKMLRNFDDIRLDKNYIQNFKRIGKGSYGEVYKALYKNQEIAVKVIDPGFSEKPFMEVLQEFQHEVQILKRLMHRNIVQFKGVVIEYPYLGIVTEYIANGSLFKVLHVRKEQLSMLTKLNMALDVAKGMDYLHQSDPVVVHRDLKSPNLLVDNDWSIKVCDFGLSRIKENTYLSHKSSFGTAEWTAPEVLQGQKATEKCDIYSFGVILWELVTNQKPWSSLSSMQVIGAVGWGGQRLDVPQDINPMIRVLIINCWDNNPIRRPDFKEIVLTLQQIINTRNY